MATQTPAQPAHGRGQSANKAEPHCSIIPIAFSVPNGYWAKARFACVQPGELLAALCLRRVKGHLLSREAAVPAKESLVWRSA